MSENGTNGAMSVLVTQRDNMLATLREKLTQKLQEREALNAEIGQMEAAERHLEELFDPPEKRRAASRTPVLEQQDSELPQEAFRFLLKQGINVRVPSAALNAHFKPERKLLWTRVLKQLINTGHVGQYGKGPGTKFCALKQWG